MRFLIVVVFSLVVLRPANLSGQENLQDLPDPLILLNGNKVENKDDWMNRRRPEILNLFRAQVYGYTPEKKIQVSYHTDFVDCQALDGKACAKSVSMQFSSGEKELIVQMMIFLPNKGVGPFPVFVGLNFNGNHTVHTYPDIPLTTHWVRNNEQMSISNNQAVDGTRGNSATRWPIETIITRGYGLATIYCGDLDPDFDDGFENGIHALFNEHNQQYGNSSWGTIGAWAWGLSRAMDYFEKDPDINEKKVAVIGHSRLGKTALWAGAQDERFAITISNNSGCGGAALSRRKSGETLKVINERFPHWFCKNFHQFNEKEEQLPVDQHMLISLIAPRPVYIASASKDTWADPAGEYLSLYYSVPVYRLLGFPVNLPEQQPGVDLPLKSGQLGYHMRNGKHDITLMDWEVYLNFADQEFAKY